MLLPLVEGGCVRKYLAPREFLRVLQTKVYAAHRFLFLKVFVSSTPNDPAMRNPNKEQKPAPPGTPTCTRTRTATARFQTQADDLPSDPEQEKAAQGPAELEKVEQSPPKH